MSIKLLIAALCVTLCVADEVKRENEVLVLTKDNFQDAIKDKSVLVEFYAPWCGHCKALAPEYEKAAQTLKAENSEILLGKVDATIETSLAEQHGVQGYPTIKFFHQGLVLEYSGGRKAGDIIKWVKKKTNPPTTDLGTVAAAKAFVDSEETAVIGFFKNQDSEEAKAYKNVAVELDEFIFGMTSDDAVFSEYKVEKDGVVLFKKFDEGRNDFDGEFTSENIKKFLRSNSLPLVVEFSHDSAQKIFGGEIKTHNLLFISKGSPDFEAKVSVFRQVAKEFKGRVLFVLMNTDDEDHDKIVEFFNLKKEELPAMRMINFEDEMTKFNPPTDGITEADIRGFVTGVLDGTIKRHMASEPIPENWDKEPVKILVGKNFDDVAFDATKNVLVEFYAPWCGHCKQLAPIYDELGELYKDNADVVIAKMDATVNDLAHTTVDSYPTIKLYKKGTNEVVSFSGERTLEGLRRFIDTDGVDGAAVKEEEEDEEEEKDDDQAKRDEL